MDHNTRWQNFLDPASLRPKLILASIYLSAFELLKISIINRIESFFAEGFNQSGVTISPKYASEVLSLNKSPLYASLLWLKAHEAIEQTDIEAFEEIKKCRNEVAHDLPQILGGESASKFDEQFPAMISLLKKIEVWWIVNLEIPTNPDFEDAEIDVENITPGPVLMLQLMTEIALGEPGKDSRYLDHFNRKKAV